MTEVLDQFFDLPLELILSGHDVLLLVLRFQHLVDFLDLHSRMKVLDQFFRIIHHVVDKLLLTKLIRADGGLVFERPKQDTFLGSKFLPEAIVPHVLLV